MELGDAIDGRHSCREFKAEPVPGDLLDRLVHAAVMAPSAMNAQPVHLHIATGDARDRAAVVMSQSTHHLQEYMEILPEDRLEAAARFFSTLGDAPVIVALSVPTTAETLENMNGLIAAGCTLQNILLTATDLGLAACAITFGFWVRDELAEAFAVPAQREVVGLIAIGYPASPAVSPEHRSDIAHYVG